MKDRVPASGKAGHVLLTPASGGTATEYVLAMADNPSSGNEGTPLNKANLLSDATATIIRNRIDSLRTAINGTARSGVSAFPSDPTVNDAFNIIGNTNLRYKVGTYQGTIEPIQAYTTYSGGTWTWSDTNAWNTKTTHKFTLNIGFQPLAISIFEPHTLNNITNYNTNNATTVSVDVQDGFTYPLQYTGKTPDNAPAYGYSVTSSYNPPMYDGNIGGHVWIYGCPIGLVGYPNSTGYQLRGIPLSWSSTGVTWSGKVMRVDDGYVEGYGTPDAYQVNPTHKWFYVDVPLAHSGRTYYYIAIGV